MRNGANPWKGFRTLLALHLLVSLAYILVFAWAFDYPLLIVPLHALNVAGLIMTGFLALGGLVSIRRFREWRAAPYAIGLLAGLGFAALSFLAMLDAIANAGWGANVTWKMLTQYFLPDWFGITGALPFYLRWLYGPVGTFFGLLIFAYLLLSRRLMRGLEELFLRERPLSLFRDARTSKASVRWILLLGVTWAALITIAVHLPPRLWRGEPILGLFTPDTMLYEGLRHADIAEADRRVRSAYPDAASFDRKNVVIIMVDSLRADHMQIYGYDRPTTPFLSRLEKTGRLHKVAFAASTCSETVCGVLSVLASREYVHLAEYNFKLNDLLRDQGYGVYFLLAGDHTAFHSEYRQALGDNMDLFFDGASSKQFSWSDDRLVLEGLEEIPDFDGTPGFFFMFLMSTHVIGVKDEAFDVFKPSRLGAKGMGYVYTGGRDCPELINRYDNSIIQADSFIERVFVRLEEKGYLDNALVCILADHGLGLGERGNYSHTVYLYQEDILIPFLIYDEPGVSYANLEFAMQEDVAPTIVERLGLPVPSCWDGHSLIADDSRTFSHHSTRRNDAWRAVLYRTEDKIYKYLRLSTKDMAAAKEELYELTRDPGESRDLIAFADPALLQLLRARMDAAFPTIAQ